MGGRPGAVPAGGGGAGRARIAEIVAVLNPGKLTYVHRQLEGERMDIRAARGVMLGLLLGDAVGTAGGSLPATGPLKAGSGGQLACWTVEGMIRAHVRGMHKGITTVSGVTWSAYRRWAAVRGELPADSHRSGWLVDVPALAERRGTAPATLSALKNGAQGSIETPVGTSIGAHAVTRTLPAGLCDWWSSQPGPAAELAALTHVGEAITAAALGAELIGRLCTGEPLVTAVPLARAATERRNLPALPIDLAEPAAPANDIDVLRRLAPNGTARSALAGGIYVAAGVQRPEQVLDALRFAASAGDGGHVATVAGALLGAVYGPAGLPTAPLARLELVWAGDTLARDLIQQVVEGPSGSEYTPGPDPTWWQRYPGG